MSCPNCGDSKWVKKEVCEQCGFNETVETVKLDPATLVYCTECARHYLDNCPTHGKSHLEKVKL